MFADSLLESAPHPGHRAAWTKLVSTLLQCTALAIALTIPFHIERLQVVPPAPSIRMTNVSQPVVHAEVSEANSSTPAMLSELVQPRFIPRQIARGDDHEPASPITSGLGVPCTANCIPGASLFTNILSPSGADIRLQPPPPPTRPVRVSEMQLGDLVRKIVPQYPMIAKQIRLQGSVVLLATVGKDGRVEHVQPMSGPPLLVRAAKEAVEQWQYRPYLLNHEPVVVQTQITVNFVLNQE